MGWLFETTPSTKADYIHRRFTGPNATSIKPCVLLDHSLGSRGLWCLLRSPDDQVFIVIFLLEHSREDGGWGYKCVEEPMGSCETDCPMRFLRQAPEPASPHRDHEGRTWRDRVRAHHATKRANAKLPRLQVGQRVRLGEPFANHVHGDYTVIKDLGSLGYLLAGCIRLTARQRKYVTIVDAPSLVPA